MINKIYFYKLICKNYVYIGSTKNFSKRKYDHKVGVNMYPQRLLYKILNENNNEFQINIIEECECNLIQRKTKEKYYIEEIQKDNTVICLNKNIPFIHDCVDYRDYFYSYQRILRQKQKLNKLNNNTFIIKDNNN